MKLSPLYALHGGNWCVVLSTPSRYMSSHLSCLGLLANPFVSLYRMHLRSSSYLPNLRATSVYPVAHRRRVMGYVMRSEQPSRHGHLQTLPKVRISHHLSAFLCSRMHGQGVLGNVLKCDICTCCACIQGESFTLRLCMLLFHL